MENEEYLKLLHLREEDGYLKLNYGCEHIDVIKRDDLRAVFFNAYFGINVLMSRNALSLNRFLRDMAVYVAEFYEYLEDHGLDVRNNLLCIECDSPGLYVHAARMNFKLHPTFIGRLQDSYDSYRERRGIISRYVEQRCERCGKLLSSEMDA